MATPFEKLSRSALGNTTRLDFSKPQRAIESDAKMREEAERKDGREEPDRVMTLRIDEKSRLRLEEMKFKRRMTYKELLQEAINDLYVKYNL